MLIQMLPAVLELRPDETDPVEIGPHCKTLIFFLDFFVPGILLGKCLMVECQSQHNVGTNFSGVQRAVEAT